MIIFYFTMHLYNGIDQVSIFNIESLLATSASSLSINTLHIYNTLLQHLVQGQK